MTAQGLPDQHVMEAEVDGMEEKGLLVKLGAGRQQADAGQM